MRYKVIALVVAVVVVAAAGAATLVDRTPTMRYVAQHEDTSVPRADAHQGLSIDPETFSSHLPVIAIDTHGQEVPGDVLYVDGEPIIREDGRTVLTTTPEGATDAQVDVRVYDAQDGSKRYVTEVMVDEAEFAAPRAEGPASAQASARPSMPQSRPAQQRMDLYGTANDSGAGQADMQGFTEVEDDDLPF